MRTSSSDNTPLTSAMMPGSGDGRRAVGPQSGALCKQRASAPATLAARERCAVRALGFGVWPHDAPVRVYARPTAADEAARPWCRSARDRVRDEPRATTRLQDHLSSVAGWVCRSTLLPGWSGVDVERDRSWLVAGRPGAPTQRDRDRTAATIRQVPTDLTSSARTVSVIGLTMQGFVCGLCPVGEFRSIFFIAAGRVEV
jgi:hypothetical protein